MTTIKNFTSLEQSKKLIELGIDSQTADMIYYWFGNFELNDEWYELHLGANKVSDKDIPAWSLAALMNFLPSKFTEVGKYSETTYSIHIRKYTLTEEVDVYQIAYGNYHWYEDGSYSWSDMINTGEKENLIDAVFQMICWLKENGKI